MATIKRFEDIQVWQKGRELSQIIYTITHQVDFSKDPELKGQILARSGSIMDNIVEGFERGGNNEFIHFLTISKGSAGEVKSQLYRALDRKYIDEKKFKIIYDLADDIFRMIAGLISYLNKTDINGPKFKDRA